jgi:hypothetical protein
MTNTILILFYFLSVGLIFAWIAFAFHREMKLEARVMKLEFQVRDLYGLSLDNVEGE